MPHESADGGRFRVQGRTAEGKFVAANTAYGSLVRDTVVVAGGSWDSDTGAITAVLLDAEGKRDEAEADGADGVPRGHLFTTLGCGAGIGSPEPVAFFQGDVAEVLVFNRLLLDDEHRQVQAYLRQRNLTGGGGRLPVSEGLVLHLDPAALNAQADVIQQWDDTSGHDNHAVSKGHPPTLSKRQTPTGLPMVRFQGDAWLEIAGRPADFDGTQRTWYLVFSTFTFNNGRMLNSAYETVAKPLAIAPGTGLERMRYHHPGLRVKLGVGLWGNPLPMDYDGDGQLDLLVAGTAKNDNTIYRFPAKRGGAVHEFEKGEPVSGATRNLQVSHPGDGRGTITSPGRRYDKFRDRGLSHWTLIDFDPPFYIGRSNLWRLYDFDGDGVEDLIISLSDWRDYGWDDNYDATGQWKNGPITGQVWWIKNRGSNENPNYETATQIKPGGKELDTYGDPAASFADFDGDGLDDMMCGEFLDALTFYKNVGTRTDPLFAEGVKLSRDGQVIRMDLQMIMPVAADWDADGHVDLIVGEEDGHVAWLRNTGSFSDGQPRFDSPQYFLQEADEIKIGVLPTPTVIDWNGDGRDDLITGDSAGYLTYLENLGGDPLRWAAPQHLQADGETIRIQAGDNGSIQGPAEAKWGYTLAHAADWDHDGLPDLLINNIFGRILWYRNIGTPTAPKLAAAQAVKVQWEESVRSPAWDWWKPADDELVLQWRTSIQAIDLTGDGLLDLVGIDEDGYLALFERATVDGQLVLLPGQRIFHVEEGQPNVFDHHGRPMSFDDNDDGKNDLAVLDAQHRVTYYATVLDKNSKKSVQPHRFADRSDDPRYGEENLSALRLSGGWAGRAGRRKFVLVDWDLDGRLDLLTNGNNIDFYRNVSDEPGKFVFRNLGPIDTLVLAGHSTCPAVADFDGNGVPDLVVGAEDGYLYYMTNPHAAGGPNETTAER